MRAKITRQLNSLCTLQFGSYWKFRSGVARASIPVAPDTVVRISKSVAKVTQITSHLRHKAASNCAPSAIITFLVNLNHVPERRLRVRSRFLKRRSLGRSCRSKHDSCVSIARERHIENCMYQLLLLCRLPVKTQVPGEHLPALNVQGTSDNVGIRWLC